MISVSLITKLINDLNKIRTRAVTARGYINSKEDILIYATKLLKAEMPLSLRLMGKFVRIYIIYSTKLITINYVELLQV
jgi:hypothetical protein